MSVVFVSISKLYQMFVARCRKERQWWRNIYACSSVVLPSGFCVDAFILPCLHKLNKNWISFRIWCHFPLTLFSAHLPGEDLVKFICSFLRSFKHSIGRPQQTALAQPMGSWEKLTEFSSCRCTVESLSLSLHRERESNQHQMISHSLRERESNQHQTISHSLKFWGREPWLPAASGWAPLEHCKGYPIMVTVKATTVNVYDIQPFEFKISPHQ